MNVPSTACSGAKARARSGDWVVHPSGAVTANKVAIRAPCGDRLPTVVSAAIEDARPRVSDDNVKFHSKEYPHNPPVVGAKFGSMHSISEIVESACAKPADAV